MSRRLANLTLDNLSDLSPQCRSCVFWELDPAAADQADDGGLDKEAWVSDTLLEWGSCGQLLYVDEKAAGYILYAPPAYVPRAGAFATSPVSPDAILLMTARIQPEFTGAGYGRILVQGVARDVLRRGIRAIEAFGRTGTPAPEPDSPSNRQPTNRADKTTCMLPADYLLAVGFKTVRPHPQTPRLRLDLRSTATWRADVEYAWERLFGSIQLPALSR
ncbi:MAG: GNAT family N-acetyltransferase [Jatrophihabitans sp.]